MTFPFEPPDRYDQQNSMYEIIGFREDSRDTYYNPAYNDEVHNLFWNVMYNDELTLDERADQEALMAQIFYDEYGLLFDDLWSWEDFRAWYENA